MHVASEPGDYIFKKSAPSPAASPLTSLNFNRNAELLDLEAVGGEELEAAAIAAAAAAAAAAASAVTDDSVCGLYVIGEPDTIVEITMKHYDVNCESGGLMAVSHSLSPISFSHSISLSLIFSPFRSLSLCSLSMAGN